MVQSCHPERSKGSRYFAKQILHCLPDCAIQAGAQNDKKQQPYDFLDNLTSLNKVTSCHFSLLYLTRHICMIILNDSHWKRKPYTSIDGKP